MINPHDGERSKDYPNLSVKVKTLTVTLAAHFHYLITQMPLSALSIFRLATTSLYYIAQFLVATMS